MRDSDSPNGKRPKIDAVFLTPSVVEFEKAWLALKTASIRLHPAATVEQAQSLMVATDSRVLLAEVGSINGGWERAAEMVGRLRPPRALVVVGTLIDEHFWISALERGAFDVVRKPFDTEELQRIIENANNHAAHAPSSLGARAG
jgi:DNA-binding NtrC family response regulator